MSDAPAYRTGLPRIEFHDSLPQWITSSDRAAYHAWSRTIFVRRGLGFWPTARAIAHELTHYAIHALHLPEAWHRRLDGGRP